MDMLAGVMVQATQERGTDLADHPVLEGCIYFKYNGVHESVIDDCNVKDIFH